MPSKQELDHPPDRAGSPETRVPQPEWSVGEGGCCLLSKDLVCMQLEVLNHVFKIIKMFLTAGNTAGNKLWLIKKVIV